MSIDNADRPCVCCSYPVNTNDSDNVVYDEESRQPMHRGCYEREVANGDAKPVEAQS